MQIGESGQRRQEVQPMAAWILPFPASEAEIASSAQDVTCGGGQTFFGCSGNLE